MKIARKEDVSVTYSLYTFKFYSQTKRQNNCFNSLQCIIIFLSQGRFKLWLEKNLMTVTNLNYPLGLCIIKTIRIAG